MTRDDTVFLDTDELMGRRIATLPSPGLGAIRLLQLTASEQGQAILASARVPAFEAPPATPIMRAIMPC